MLKSQIMSGNAALPIFKVILLGQSGVGKTSIFVRVKSGIFEELVQPCIGIDNCTKDIDVTGERVIITVWDTAGVEKFRTVTRNYYRRADAALLIYSVDNPASIQYLSKWAHDADEFAPSALKFLIGNKADLESIVTNESAKDFAHAHDCSSAYLTSAKSGGGIEEAIRNICEKLILKYKRPSMVESIFDDSFHIHNNNTKNDNAIKCPC